MTEQLVPQAAGLGPPPDIPPYLSGGDFTYRWSPVPNFVSSRGCLLYDDQGRAYLDGEAANGAAALGFDNSILRRAAERAQELPALPSFCESELRRRVARRIEALVAEAVGVPGRVAFELGGAQGMELAMKVVAANNGRGPAITFEGGYHGRSPYTSQLSASHRYRQLLGTGIAEVYRLPHPDCERCPFGRSRDTCQHECVAFVERLGRDDLAGLPTPQTGKLAALVLEPILNVGGMARPDSAYLQATVRHFRDLGALIVVDEIFTGFYRTGPLWGFQVHGIEPDIIVASKGLTNGIGALSVVWARDPLMAPRNFPPGTHSSTYSGNPFMLAVADVVLDRFQQWADRDSRLRLLHERLGRLVGRLRQRFSFVASGYALGGLARVVLTAACAPVVRTTGLQVGWDDPVDGVHGVVLASTGMAADVVALHPPLTMTDHELDVLEHLVLRTFARVDEAWQ